MAFFFFFKYFGSIRMWLIIFARKLLVPQEMHLKLQVLLERVFFKCRFFLKNHTRNGSGSILVFFLVDQLFP